VRFRKRGGNLGSDGETRRNVQWLRLAQFAEQKPACILEHQSAMALLAEQLNNTGDLVRLALRTANSRSNAARFTWGAGW
jgi:hypothetical protein